MADGLPGCQPGSGSMGSTWTDPRRSQKALPRAAVGVEHRSSQIYKQVRVRPALIADGLAECQIRWPNIPIVFCETRGLAEEWTYRYLAAAHAWASAEPAAIEHIGTQ